MQMMAVFSDGRLKQVEGHVRKRHRLLYNHDIDQFPPSVNSYHRQVLVDCPSTFKVLATSEDGNIEAIEHNDLPWEGWMCTQSEKVHTQMWIQTDLKN